MNRKMRVAVLIGPNFHDQETTEPKEYLEQKGVEVDIIGLEGSTLTGKNLQKTLTPDKTIGEIDASDYDGIIIPGGGAPERIRLNGKAIDFVKAFWATGRPIGAICHGPQVLISADVLAGVTTTCYAGIRDDVRNAGATYVDKEVAIDGQLITSRTPDDLPAFNQAFAQALLSGFPGSEEEELDALSALSLAISREKGAQEFYQAVAEKVKNEPVQNKFQYLSAVEKGHYDQLSELYHQVSGGNDPQVDLKKTEIGTHKVSSDLTAKEAIEIAMNAEQKAYEFYRRGALKVKSPRAKEMFEYLAAEELEHKRLLLIDKAGITDAMGHFQWATHFDIPPGMDDLW